MAIKLPDIVKEIKTYTISGLVLIAAWLLLLPAFVGHLDDQRLTRHLTAYLSIKDALARATVFFEIPDHEWLPPTPNMVFALGGRGGSDVFECEVKLHREAGGARAPDMFQLWCKPLEVSSQERKNQSITLRMKRIDIPGGSRGILAYYSIEAAHAVLPFSAYRALLTKRLTDPSPDSEEVEESKMAADGHPKIRKARAEFFKDHEVLIVRADVSEGFLQGVGDEEADIVDSLLRAAYGTEDRYREARQPVGWGRIRELLRDGSGKTVELAPLTLESPSVQRLVRQYIYQEGTYDVAGIKVAISQVPWAIAVVLLMLSCVLMGKLSSLKRAQSSDLSDDFGWLFLQSPHSGDPGVRLAAVLLTLLTGGVILVALLTTVAEFPHVEPLPRAALCALLVGIGSFSLVSMLIVHRQVVLSKVAMNRSLIESGISEPPFALPRLALFATGVALLSVAAAVFSVAAAGYATSSSILAIAGVVYVVSAAFDIEPGAASSSAAW